MSSLLRPTRYAHSDGLTDVCYSDDGRLIITCGQDGDVRLFEGLDDDDCKTHTISDATYAVAYKGGCILVGTDLNMVQEYSEDEGKPSGIITRFTDHPTHIDVYKEIVAAGSNDMTIKVHDSANFKDSIFTGHEAPVLSVSIDPMGDFIASSSCDGTVRIWNIRTQTIVRSFPILTKSNSISISKSLCRLKWSHNGDRLFVPIENEIHVYERAKWKVEYTLKLPDDGDCPSVLAISPCDGYVVAGCKNGTVAVWNIENKKLLVNEKQVRNLHITGISWHPHKDEIAFVNAGGELSTMENFLAQTSSRMEGLASSMEGAASGMTKEDAGQFVDENLDLDDENEISLAKIKSQMGFADDEEGTFIGLPSDNLESVSRSKASTPVPTERPIFHEEFKLPEPQKPFQPGMSPDHLSDRYMMWNNTGIVRQYTTDAESSIEVDFHDSSVHHALHLNNHFGHFIAQLNTQMLALGAESQDDQLSKVVVHHFSAWDGSNEWQVDLPEGEEVVAIALGNGWLCVATDQRNLRIFSSAGVQRDILSVAGPVVCMAAHENFLFVVFHAGLGVLGEQSMSCRILNIKGRGHYLAQASPLPLCPNGYLSWAGFTDEGTPLIMDSAGNVRILRSNMGNCWTIVLNTKDHAVGKTDHYFLVGASEGQDLIRCIMCKGSRFPPVLPRPHVSMLEFKIPLCEAESEKSQLEEKRLRSSVLLGTYERLEKNGYDVEVPIAETTKNITESLIKLLALACRSSRESRALEVCQLLPNSGAVQLAIRYAGGLRRNQLAERLSQLAENKMEEEMSETRNQDVLSQEDNEETPQSYENNHQNMQEDMPDDWDTDLTMSTGMEDSSANIQSSKGDVNKSNPLFEAAMLQQNSKDKNMQSMLKPTMRNPFKKSNKTDLSNDKGLKVLDTIKPVKKESQPLLRPTVKLGKSRSSINSKEKLLGGKENKGASPVIAKTHSNPFAASLVANKATKDTAVKKVSALKLWLDDHIDLVKEKFPEASEFELLGKAALIFKDVDEETKEKYKDLSANPEAIGPLKACETKEEKLDESSKLSVDCSKRKLDDDDSISLEESTADKKMKQESKLSAFAFVKKAS